MTTGGPDPLDPFDRPPDPSPWAPDGASDGRVQLRVETAPEPIGDSSGPIVFDAPTLDVGESVGDEPRRHRAAGPGSRRRALVAVGAFVAAIAVAIGASLIVPSPEIDGDVTATPAVRDTVIDTSDPQVGPLTEPDDESDGEALPGLADGDGDGDGDGEIDPNDPDGDGIPLRVDVPEPLASLTTPTEIVTLTADGRHVTVSLPSGGVHVAPVDIDGSSQEVFFNSSLLATPSFSVFEDRGDLVVVGRSGEAIAVVGPDTSPDGASVQQMFPIGWARLSDGSDVAVLAMSDFSGLQPSFAAVTADGEVTAIDLDSRVNFFEPVPAVFDDGAVIVEDGGLIVRRSALDQPGEAIASGDLLAGGPAGSVVRRCDDPDMCVVELIDATGQTISAVAPNVVESLRTQFFGGSVLSPSGEHVLVRGPTGDLPPNQAWVLAVRLVDGEATPVVGLSDVFSGEFPSWIADGSAIVGRPAGRGAEPFPDAPGIEVVPLDPDLESFRFAEEIGTVLSLTTRFPDAELPVPAPITTTALDGVPLAAIGLPAVIVAEAGGRVSRIDFSTGQVMSWRAGLAPGWAGAGGAQVIPRHRGGVTDESPLDVPPDAVVVNRDGDEAISIDADEIAVLPDWPAGTRYPFDLELIWAPVSGGSGAPDTYRLVDPQSITRGDARVPVSDVIGSDGEGGLFHEYAGDVWVSDFDTTTRITSGEMWATNDASTLIRECDADLVCGTRIVDRETGERRASGPPLGELAVGAVPGRDVTLAGTLSPDGRWALVELDEVKADEVSESWGFVELATGTIVPTAAPDPLHPVVWSDEGNVAVFVAERRLRMLDTAALAIVGDDGGLGGFDGLVAMGPAPS